MERPFVRCVPPSAFLLPPPVPRLLLRWLCHLSPGKKDFILLLLCWRLQFKKILWTHQMHTHTHTHSLAHTHVPLSVSHTHRHTLKSDNFMSNCFPGDMKQHLSKRKHGSSSGCEEGRGGGRRILRLGSASRAGKNGKTSRPATPWRAAGAAAVRSHCSPLH